MSTCITAQVCAKHPHVDVGSLVHLWAQWEEPRLAEPFLCGMGVGTGVLPFCPGF